MRGKLCRLKSVNNAVDTADTADTEILINSP